MIVARLRWIEANMTAAEIVTALEREDPPIRVCVRTVERDITAIRQDARQYLTANHFDARLEIGMCLARYEVLARAATRYALMGNGGSRWARAAIAATAAKTQLLQDIGLIDRKIGTLFIDDGKAERIPRGVELQKLFDSVGYLRSRKFDLVPRHSLDP